MPHIKKFFSNPIVLSIIGLLALSSLIWFGLDYIKFGENNATVSNVNRVAIIAFCWGGWIVWNLAYFMANRQKNIAMVNDIQASNEPVLDPDEERSIEERNTMASRFNEAMAILKTSRFNADGKKKSLYQLPWYIIIGPPGAGKTTALVNSGLEFPLANTHGKESLNGIGGTRNCDWWFTNNAVLIDTAGRYTTQDSHRVIDNAAWFNFLGLLKKHRRRRPINGVIIAISIQDLMLQNAEQRMHHAKTIRSRIDELHKDLGIQFPIYVNFTKCDLVSGFSEFFANLSQAEREQVWGMTFEEGTPTKQPLHNNQMETFGNEFNKLIQRLNDRLLWRVHQERSLERRALIQGFPARLESMRNILVDFFQHTFSENPYNQSPMIRGVYFSSATQEGTPIDRMMASLSSTFGVNKEATNSQLSAGKSFFLTRLLKDVIFAESELVGVNPKIEQAMTWMRRSAFAFLAFLFIGSMSIWASSITRNKLYMSDVEGSAQVYQLANQKLRPYSTNAAEVLPALNPLRISSQVYDREDHPWLSGLGLYDESVNNAAKALYHDKLTTLFLPRILRDLEQILNRMNEHDDDLFSTLRIYLMLLNPDQRINIDIVNWAEQHWQQQYSGEGAQQEDLLDHLDALLALDLPILQGSDRTISHARSQLSRTPIAHRLYQKIQQQSLEQAPINLYANIGDDTQLAFDIAGSSNFFIANALHTKSGYSTIDIGTDSDVIKKLEEDNWILGAQAQKLSSEDKKKLSEDIKKIYLADYNRHWQSFSAGLSIKKFNHLHSALESLRHLSDPVYSPILTTTELIADNTQLTPSVDINPKAVNKAPIGGKTRLAGEMAINSLGKHIKPTPVDIAFRDLHRVVKSTNNRPPEIQSALQSLDAVYSTLSDIANSPNPQQSAFQLAKARFNGSNDAIKQLRIKAAQLPAPLDRWLEETADHTWSLLLVNAKSHINQVWQDKIYGYYHDELKDYYPLQKGHNQEIPLEVFNQFFNNSGLEQAFVENYLAPFLDTKTWRTKSVDGRSIIFDSNTVDQLRQAEKIRSAFYASGNSAAIKFKATPSKLDSSVRLFSLELGDKKVPYSHGPRITKSLNWSAGEDSRVRILFEDLNQSIHRKHFEGDWAWYRLLDESNVHSSGNSRQSKITFEERGRKAEFILATNSSVNPFDVRVLRDYKPPRTL